MVSVLKFVVMVGKRQKQLCYTTFTVVFQILPCRWKCLAEKRTNSHSSCADLYHIKQMSSWEMKGEMSLCINHWEVFFQLQQSNPKILRDEEN